MKTLYMTKGLPAFGKTTASKQLLAELGTGNATRVNKDDLRSMMDSGVWTKDNEKFVLKIRDGIIVEALTVGRHVIVDDTNLAPKHEERLRQLARENGANFEILDFTHISVDVCIERDRKRPNYVGEKVIRDMYEQFLKPKVEPPPHDTTLPDCVIIDIDGTVATMNGRSPFDWERVGEDSLRQIVINAAESLAYYRGCKRLFLSGRDERCRFVTNQWLGNHAWPGYELLMRSAGDTRKDSIVKRELYEKHIIGKYNVAAIFDDRPQVIRMWRELGFGDRLFDVGSGREF